MQNTQDFQAVQTVKVQNTVQPVQPVQLEPIYSVPPAQQQFVIAEEMTPEAFMSQMMKKQDKMIAEQTQNINNLKELQTPFLGPIAPLFWTLLGVVLYATICKIIENKRYFLDFVDKMWTEIRFLKREDTEMEAQIKRINQRLENLEEKVVYYEKGANNETPGLGFDFPEFIQKGVEK